MRDRVRARRAPVHDWRTTLLPAAIRAGMSKRPLSICLALAEHQRGRYPEVFVGTEELAEELGIDRRNLQKDLRRLERHGLIKAITGGGRLVASKTGRANVYQLGAACAHDVEAVSTASKTTHLTASKTTQYPRVSPTRYCVENDAPTPRTPTEYFGGSGERTAALTSGPSPDNPELFTGVDHAARLRAKLGVLNPVRYESNGGSVNAR